MMNLIELAQVVAGIAHGGDPTFSGVGTDSRSVIAGHLFVALKGDRFDGHDYLTQVAHGGAAAALVSEEWLGTHEAPLPVVAVKNPLHGLGQLAAEWRRRCACPVIALTGSNGKTTTKEMIAAILRAQAAQDGDDPELAVLATAGNFNNDIGLPLTLLRLRHSHRYAVVELGMNHPGEIAYLARIANPDVALVTNAQRAHLEGLGSLDGVAREKGSLFAALSDMGIAVINADDVHAPLWREMAEERKTITFGCDRPADVSATWHQHGLQTDLTLSTPLGDTTAHLRVPGLHNARNALGAAAAAIAVGASLDAVREGLEGFGGVKGRLQLRRGVSGSTVLDDTYNANPDSLRAAIEVLAATPGRTILVLGDMGEIGDHASQCHDEAGGYAKSAGLDALFALGEHSALAARNFGAGGAHFKSVESLVSALRPLLDANTVVLVKGSRFMRMERVADALCPVAGAEAPTPAPTPVRQGLRV